MSGSVSVASTRERVLAALDRVIDPELDEPITSLRFISSCEITPDGDVELILRLPTPQCAPNFAFLMAADARRVLSDLPGLRQVSVALEDHYTGAEINGALGRGEGFTGAFPGETEDDDLEALRELFQRKALIARQSKTCEALLAAGATAEQVLAMRVGDLPTWPEATRSLELRAALGLDTAPDSPAFVLATGDPVEVASLQRWLRMARLVRTSLEANGGICRELLKARHNLAAEPEEVAR